MRVLACLALLTLMPGCKPSAEPPAEIRFEPTAFDGQKAYEEVESFVAVGPRDAGTPGAYKAAQYIHDRLKAHQWDVEIVTFEDDTPDGIRPFHNVVARLEGISDQRILLGSHFDSKAGIPDFQGANDSGSSTGALIEMARGMTEAAKKGKPKLGIELVFFDGEECRKRYGPNDGFHGSRYHVRYLRGARN